MANVVFSFEIGSREVLPRMAIALALQQHGFSVTIGHKLSVDRFLKRCAESDTKFGGLFIYKDATTDSVKYMKTAKSVGLSTVGLDEEFLNWDEPYDSAHFISPQSLGVVDYFFASTLRTSQIARRLGFAVMDLGNLRLSFCEGMRSVNKEEDAVQTRNILINTPGGYFFNLYPIVSHLEIWGRLSESNWRKPFEQLREFSVEEFRNVNTIIRIADSFSEAGDKVTIRSHPAEVVDFWRNLFDDPRITVQPGIDSSILTALDHDEVHGFDCTTLLEAHVLGRPYKNHSTALNSRSAKTLVRRFLHPDATPSDHDVLRSLLFLPDIESKWVDCVRALVAVSSGENVATPIASDCVAGLPPDMSLRKGSVSMGAIKRVIEAFTRKSPPKLPPKIKVLSRDNDFLYFPKIV